jgi:hypothetical protein
LQIRLIAGKKVVVQVIATSTIVIPAKAGIQKTPVFQAGGTLPIREIEPHGEAAAYLVPAFAGMTTERRLSTWAILESLGASQ